MNLEYLITLKPDPNYLLKKISCKIDDALLLHIAKSDYNYNSEKIFLILKNIVKNQTIENPQNSLIFPVLELMRWSEPECNKQRDIVKINEGHLMRAFCCSILLLSGSHKDNCLFIVGENETIINLIESLLALDDIFLEEAISLFAYRLLNYKDPLMDVEHPFFILGLMALLAKKDFNLHLNMLSELSICLINEEKYFQKLLINNENVKDAWLLNVSSFNQYKLKWQKVGRDILRLCNKHPNANGIKSIIFIANNLIK